jgi:hypothetical protein
MGGFLGSLGDVSQVLNLVIRLIQALLTAIQFFTGTAVAAARQNDSVAMDIATTVMSMLSEGFVGFIRTYVSDGLGDVVENYLIRLDVI